MLTYRAHVYNLAMAASAEATDLALALARCEAALHVEPDHRSTLEGHLPNLTSQAVSLRGAVDGFYAALPPGVQEHEPSRLLRHMAFIERYLGMGQPQRCSQDPADIVQLDLPVVLKAFEEWYERSSPVEGLGARLEPLIASGQLNAAVREAWAIFKTRMVALFSLPGDIDGDRLAGQLFGGSAVTAPILPGKEREAYLHLFKGLYALSRNPIAHNDLPPNPEETDAVLTLVNSALVKIEAAYQAAVASTATPSGD